MVLVCLLFDLQFVFGILSWSCLIKMCVHVPAGNSHTLVIILVYIRLKIYKWIKVFIRESVERELEEMRSFALFHIVVTIQKHVKRWIAVQRYRRILRAIVVIQSFSRMQVARREYDRRLGAVITIQAFARMIKPRFEKKPHKLGLYGCWCCGCYCCCCFHFECGYRL